ncbi:MAG: hypothetical protein HC929_03550 [Leptolyngbyaceae cyanobacterium SM2_5_2]|nr:hypothetical protein [Leptolyngbyaceae cyanobacterium SM2_5_2]
MKKRCLPCHLIISNVCLVLLAIASSVVLVAELHASANSQPPATVALRRLFAYQVMLNADEE